VRAGIDTASRVDLTNSVRSALSGRASELVWPVVDNRSNYAALFLRGRMPNAASETPTPREHGYSWAFIGSLIDTTGEAARQRYGRKQHAYRPSTLRRRGIGDRDAPLGPSTVVISSRAVTVGNRSRVVRW